MANTRMQLWSIVREYALVNLESERSRTVPYYHFESHRTCMTLAMLRVACVAGGIVWVRD